MAFPFLQAGLGVLGGLFSKGPSIPPEQRQLFRLQRDSAREMRDYSQGVPLSDPSELAALASQRGLLGQQQRGLMSGLFSNLGAGGSPAPMDFMSNLATQFQGQQSGLVGQALQNSLLARRQALMQSAQIAQGAVPASQRTDPGFDIGSVLSNLAQQFAYRNALRRNQQQQGQGQGQGVIPPTHYGTLPPPGFGLGGGGMGGVTLNPGRLTLPGYR